MSKGNMLVVVYDKDKKSIATVTKGANPIINDVGATCQFSFVDIEVDLTKNADLAGLQDALDKLGVDDYAQAVTVERKATLDIYGSPHKFGLSKVLSLKGHKITEH
jgi:hypothetical protein